MNWALLASNMLASAGLLGLVVLSTVISLCPHPDSCNLFLFWSWTVYKRAVAKGLKCPSTYQLWEYICVLPFTEGLIMTFEKNYRGQAYLANDDVAVDSTSACEALGP